MPLLFLTVAACGLSGPGHERPVQRVRLELSPLPDEPQEPRTVSLELPVGATVDGDPSHRIIYVRDAGGATILDGVYLDPGRHEPEVDLPCVPRHAESAEDFAICESPRSSPEFHVVGYNAAADVSCGGGTVPLETARDLVRLCRSLRAER